MHTDSRKKFISSSSTLIISSLGVNGVNYLFHLMSARMLSIENYGIFQTILSFVGILTVVTVLVRLQLTRKLASYVKEKKYSFASSVTYVTSIMAFLAITGIYLLVLLFNLLAPHIESQLLDNSFVIYLLTLLTILTAINRAVMRAYLSFLSLAVSANLQSIFRLAAVALLLLSGFKLQGAFLGTIAALIFIYLVSFWQLGKKLYPLNFDIPFKKNIRFPTKETLSTTLGFLGLTSLISSDLILIQHFLPHEAGFYAGMMLFGKVIILFTTPFSAVLFPALIHSKEQVKTNRLFRLSFLLVTSSSVGIFLSYLLFAQQIIPLVLSPSYLVIAPLLPLYALVVMLYSISYLLVNGFLALKQYTPCFISLAVAILQIVSISVFHEDIKQVIYISLVSNFILALSLTLMLYGKSKVSLLPAYDK